MKAIFAGTFDPFTSGHRNIAERAAAVFGNVTVAVAAVTGKNAAPLDVRIKIAEAALAGQSGACVQPFDGLLSDFCKKNAPCVLVRGVRSAVDLDYETTHTRVYNSLCGVQSVLFITDTQYAHVSSTVVRELISLGAPLDGYVVSGTEKMIAEFYGAKSE